MEVSRQTPQTPVDATLAAAPAAEPVATSVHGTVSYRGLDSDDGRFDDLPFDRDKVLPDGTGSTRLYDGDRVVFNVIPSTIFVDHDPLQGSFVRLENKFRPKPYVGPGWMPPYNLAGFKNFAN